MTVSLRDSDGTTRLEGDLLATGGATGDVLTQQADGTYAPAPGGSPPASREELSSNGVSIPQNDFAWVPWDVSDGPDVVLDRSVVAHPAVITAGVYLVSATLRCSPGNADGTFNAGLYLDRSGFNASQVEFLFNDGVAIDTTIAFAWYIPAGGKVEVGVDYASGSVAPANAYILSAHVQRLS